MLLRYLKILCTVFLITIVCPAIHALEQFHDVVLILDPEEADTTRVGHIGALTAQLKLGTYDEVPMIVSGSLEMSGLLASTVPENVQMLEKYKMAIGEAGEERGEAIAQVFEHSVSSQAAGDFKACLISMTNEKWYVYAHKDQDLLLKVPKSYIGKNVDTTKYPDPDEQVERCGFRVRGKYSELEKVPDVTNDALLDFLKKRAAKKAGARDDWSLQKTRHNFIQALQSFFVLAGEDTTGARWFFYWSGHGGPVGPHKGNVMTEEKQWREVTKFDSSSAVVVGVPFNDYQEMLKFFREQLRVAWLSNINCFPGAQKQWFIEQALKDIDADFPVVLIGQGSSYVYSNIMGTALFEIQEEGDKKKPVIKFKYSLTDYFKALRLYFGDARQREEFIKRTADSDAHRKTTVDLLANIIKNMIREDRILDFNNQPFIYFPHIGVFGAVGIDKKIQIITKLVAQAHEFEGSSIDVSKQTAALVYPAIIRPPVILGDTTLVVSELASTPKQDFWTSTGYRYSVQSIDYNQIHLFKALECRSSLDQCMYNLVKKNPSFYKVFLIENLNCSNFEDSEIVISDKTSNLLDMKNVIVLIRRAGEIYTYAGVEGTVDVVGMVGTDMYSCTWNIKDFEKIMRSEATTALRFMKNIELEKLASELLREDDLKKFNKAVDKNPDRAITEKILFDTLASIVEKKSQKVTDVQDIGAFKKVVSNWKERQKEAQKIPMVSLKTARTRNTVVPRKTGQKTGEETAQEEKATPIRDTRQTATYTRFYNKGQGPLHIAVDHNDLPDVEKLLASGIDVNIRDDNGKTPLYIACEKNVDIKIVEKLLIAGAKTNIRDKKGVAPLLQAAINRSKTLIELLLDHKADIDAKDNNGATPLLFLAQNMQNPNITIWERDVVDAAYLDIFQLLLDRGADINARTRGYGDSLLDYCAKYRYKKIVELLLKRGADINRTVNDGQTVLMSACQTQEINDAIVELLLIAGADKTINVQDKKNQTALFFATKSFYYQTVDMLLKNGADWTIERNFDKELEQLSCGYKKKFSEGHLRTPLQFVKEYEAIDPGAYGGDVQKVIKLLEDWDKKKPEERKAAHDKYYADVIMPKRKIFEEEKAKAIKEHEEKLAILRAAKVRKDTKDLDDTVNVLTTLKKKLTELSQTLSEHNFFVADTKKTRRIEKMPHS